MKEIHSGSSRETGRSVVMGTQGMVASSQPLASVEGVKVLMDGGNAADASIAMAAVLNVVEPMMTGLGGDMFAIYYNGKNNSLSGLNGSGASPAAATREYFIEKGLNAIPEEGIYPVTVPAALRGWMAIHERYCTKELSALLAPAIRLAEEGFPVAEKTAARWRLCEAKLSRFDASATAYLVNGKAPRAGDLFSQPDLAATFRAIAKVGADAFYKGRIAEKIVDCSQSHSGLLVLEDLERCRAQWVDPISTKYEGHEVYELPPNGQGLVALEALNILSGFDLANLGHNSAEYLHLMIEATRRAFADGHKFIADPDLVSIPLDILLSMEYAQKRALTIDPLRADVQSVAGNVSGEGDTTYFTVADRDMNILSFINSIFHQFGSGLVVRETGVCLGNRGSLFSLDEDHLNVIAPGKRPYNTIIPAMVFKDKKPTASFGVMGGFMQPQGHLQVISNLFNFNMNIQQAIESPRYRVMENGELALEPALASETGEKLAARGHNLTDGGKVFFGGSQGIIIDHKRGLFQGGSDPRMDGCALGF